MTAPTSLRPATGADEPFLLRLYASTRPDITGLVLGEKEKAGLVRMQFDAQRQHYARTFPNAEHSIILVAGRPAGRLYVNRGADEYRVVDLSILPEYRGGGIATRLLERVLDQARGAGTPVRLHVEHLNPARRLYEGLGFVPISETDSHTFMEWRPPTGIVIPGS